MTKARDITVRPGSTLRDITLRPGDEFMVPQGMPLAGRWLIVSIDGGRENTIYARRSRRGAVVMGFNPNQPIRSYTPTQREGQMPETTQETSPAIAALDKIRDALNDEIDVSVDQDLVDAFATIAQALNSSGTTDNEPAADSADDAEKADTSITDELRAKVADAVAAIGAQFTTLSGNVKATQISQIAQTLQEVATLHGQLANLLRADDPQTATIPFTPFAPFAVVSTAGEEANTEIAAAFGSKIGINDKNGKPLRVGDTVRFTESNRYGSGEATVVGVGDNDDYEDDDAYRRPKLKLKDGQDDAYEPTARRVERIGKANEATGEVEFKEADGPAVNDEF